MLFEGHGEIIDKLIKNQFPQLMQPDDVVVEQNNRAMHFIFIAEGKCIVEQDFREKKEKDDENDDEDEILNTLKKGDYFGELALINNCRRTATVTSADYCTFAKIDKEILLNVGDKFIKQLKQKG